jgi:hypothetical protein
LSVPNGFGLSEDEFLEHLRLQLGWEPALIQVREFHSQVDLAVYRWPGLYQEILEHPDSSPGPWGDDDVERLSTVQRWLDRGNFVIDCGNDYWAGPDGTIHSS